VDKEAAAQHKGEVIRALKHQPDCGDAESTEPYGSTPKINHFLLEPRPCNLCKKFTKIRSYFCEQSS